MQSHNPDGKAEEKMVHGPNAIDKSSYHVGYARLTRLVLIWPAHALSVIRRYPPLLYAYDFQRHPGLDGLDAPRRELSLPGPKVANRGAG